MVDLRAKKLRLDDLIIKADGGGSLTTAQLIRAEVIVDLNKNGGETADRSLRIERVQIDSSSELRGLLVRLVN
ncbi:MAG: hypothetical protein ACR2II_06385 [Chthoniobacterales bacterium]